MHFFIFPKMSSCLLLHKLRFFQLEKLSSWQNFHPMGGLPLFLLENNYIVIKVVSQSLSISCTLQFTIIRSFGWNRWHILLSTSPNAFTFLVILWFNPQTCSPLYFYPSVQKGHALRSQIKSSLVIYTFLIRRISWNEKLNTLSFQKFSTKIHQTLTNLEPYTTIMDNCTTPPFKPTQATQKTKSYSN